MLLVVFGAARIYHLDLEGWLLAAPLRLWRVPGQVGTQPGLRHMAPRSGPSLLQKQSWSRARHKMSTGDRDLRWIWNSPCPRFPRPSCRCTLHHLLQVQVISLLLFSVSARNTFFLFRSVKPIFSNSSNIKNWQEIYQLPYSALGFIWSCWKLVELGKTYSTPWVFRKFDLCGGIAGFRGSARSR